LHLVLSTFGDAVDLVRHAAILRGSLSPPCSCRRRAGRLALADLEFPRGVMFLVGSYGEVPRGRLFEFGVCVCSRLCQGG
jgi:hypothetical protein